MKYDKNKHYQLVQNRRGFDENQRGFNVLNAYLTDFNPNLHDNAWLSGGHENGTRNWGWAVGAGDETGVTEGNSISASVYESSETNQGRNLGGFDWSSRHSQNNDL